ncbi:MAG: excinuclease ABC subunit UvrC [Rikenellaceae bacterium]
MDTSLLPQSSGVYKFLDSSGEVIYVGKAVNLRSRVSSYFNNSANHSAKVKVLVKKIAKIEHIVVESERDALLLENNLIKELQPRYNILLKDSKTYPWICITREPFPRIISSRKQQINEGEYFGPYASVGVQRVILKLLHSLFPLRTCKHKLTPQNIAKGNLKVCLKFHMGHCRGGCEGLESEEHYLGYINKARQILRGSFSAVQSELKEQMVGAASILNFEEAESIKRKLLSLNDYKEKSVVVSNHLGTLDVVSILSHSEASYCNFLRVVGGAIIGCYSFELKGALGEKPEELLGFALSQLELTAPEIVVPFLASQEYCDSEILKRCFVPQRGDKVRLLELSEKNSKFYRLEKIKNTEKRDPEAHSTRLMQAMQRELNLKCEPRHIECFDNSNLGGEYAVAACVVFRDGKPAKREYRHFNIKTVEGADDFATMREVVSRRYRRLLDEGKELPQLIVIDGGKGQLGNAYNALCELGIEDKITVVGLAKRLEELFFIGDPTPLYLDKKGETLRTIMYLRDEAHRFGITFHRKKRSLGRKNEFKESKVTSKK